jgi:hypothetical protein
LLFALSCLFLATRGYAQAPGEVASGPDQSADASDTVSTEPPAEPPRVSFIGGQLSIDATDSRLSDVLKLVEEMTGAQVDMPPTADKQRIVAHLGPGNPRDVVGDLLYGLPFNYVIAGSDTNPDELHSLLLTDRKVTLSTAVASARTPVVAPRPSPFARPAPLVPQPEETAAADNTAMEQAQVPYVQPTTDPALLPAPPTGNLNDNRQVSAVATQAVLTAPQNESSNSNPNSSSDQSNAPARPIDQMSSTLSRLYQARQQIQERQNQQNQPKQPGQ